MDSRLKQALALHQAGKLADAADVYKAILAAEPDNVDALNLLGALAHAMGRHELAIALASRAVARAPDYAAPQVTLGNALQSAGRLEEAAKAFRRACDLAPTSAEAHVNLASALNALGRHADGAAAARRAIQLAPGLAAAHNNLGNALAGERAFDAAVASYREALAIDRSDAAAHYNLATALVAAGDPKTALHHFARAVNLDPASPAKHYNLGNTALALDLYEEAANAFAEAVRLDPAFADAHNNLGSALQSLGRLDDAVASFRQAVALESESADVHWNLALALLQRGDYREGWAEYEWRWKNPAFTTPRRDFGKPLWDGKLLEGRAILLHAEQGMGDALQFARYAPLVHARGGRVVLECRPPLRRLLTHMPGIDRTCATGDALPAFDVQAPLMSLPHIFGTMLDTIPAAVPYLRVPADTAVDLPNAGTGELKVGFAWAGSPTRREDRIRSVEASRFRPLFQVPGTRFYALQVGARAGGFQAIADAENVHDLAPAIGDFADTAAALEKLDLVITVDTAVAHLAGALARPVWVLVPFARTYLWLAGRDDSPWYPTLRLFGQTKPGAWDPVFARVRDELSRLVGRGA